QSDPDIAADDLGNFLVVWTDYRQHGYPYYADIYGQFYDYNNNPVGENFRISLANASSKGASVAVDDDGNYIVSWFDLRGGNWDIYAQRYSADRQPVGSNFKVNDDNGSGWQHLPMVCAASDGSFVIAWADYRDSVDDIYAQIYNDNGNPVGSNFRVNSNTDDTKQNAPSIDCDGEGHFIIAWQDYRNGDYPDNPDIYARKFFNDGTPVSAEFKVNSDTLHHRQLHPSVAVDDSGNFAVCWDDYRNGEYPDNPDIYCQKYSPDLTPEDSNFIVNNDTTEYSQVFPNVALNGTGIYTTWTDRRNPSNDFDVYASEIDWDRIRAPQIFVNPSEIEFGLVRIGDSDTSQFVISNIGNAGLTVDSMTFSGTAYELSGTIMNLFLSPGVDTTLYVVFAPPDSFDYPGLISIYNNDPENPVAEVSLNGIGYRNDYAPTAFNLVYPGDEAVLADSNVTFIWNRSIDYDPGDYVRYKLVYSENESFADSTMLSDISDTTRLIALNDNSCYYWRVFAYDRYDVTTRCNPEYWTVYIDTGPDPPGDFYQIYPANGQTIGEMLPELVWQSSIDPDYGDEVAYTCYFADNEDFINQSVFNTGNDTTITLPDSLEDNTSYYWKVVAVDLNNDSTWADTTAWAFNIDQTAQLPSEFDLIYPPNLATVNQGDSFIWQQSIDPDPSDTLEYELWYSTDSTFRIGAVISGLADTTYPIANLVENAAYFWKVKVSDSYNNTIWSNQTHWRFFNNSQNDPPGSFSILTPPEGVTVGTEGVMLSWEKPLDPDPDDRLMYNIYFAPGEPPDSNRLPIAVTPYEYFMCYDADEQGTYYWKVEAFDSEGEVSISTGAPHSFYAGIGNPLADFNLIAPINGFELETMSVYFVWESSSGASEITYYVTVALDTNFTKSGKYYTTADTSLLVSLNDLPEDTTVYWRVIAVDEDGNFNISNQLYWNFRLGRGDDYQVGFSLIYPGNYDTIQQRLPEFVWHPAPQVNPPGALSYRLYYDTDPQFPMPSIILGIDDTTAIPTRELAPGVDYFWKVESYIQDQYYCQSFGYYQFIVDQIVHGGDDPGLPLKTGLLPPYPNPFNPSTTIRFTVAEFTRVRISIYNLLGQKTASLYDNRAGPGEYSVIWNTADDGGNGLSSGLYFCVMRTDTEKFTRKIALLK
ncbi:MAG: T9SS type A sorting domain-containing protein, partial [candidate division Zixibacteria bacterium]|nr:T9SS type A sorting domain-containing protein [candidate division Zixibacteria bacterium]